MKIGIITHYDVHNHGAQLQLYALIKELSLLGHSAVALSYTKNFDFLNKEAKNKYNITIRSIPYYVGYLMKNGIRKTFFNIKKKVLLDQFQIKNNLVGGYYSREENLDCVFVGSDEVFSIETGLNAFFWGMGVPAKRVFSYAASFGPTTIETIGEKHAEEFVVAGINRFKNISVRDKNSQDIIFRLTQKIAPIVCDPVILYGYKNEIIEMKNPAIRNYVVVYAYDKNMNNKEEVRNILAFARANNLKVISVGFYHSWCDKNINASPFELINYIKNAECVITDTFHGTVISIVMNKPFITKVRGNKNKLNFLLEQYGLSSRETTNFLDLDAKYKSKIDFNRINSVIIEERKSSRDYIQECLGGIATL